ncbi:MAG: hypothetical protein AAGD22_02730 [Verrucomicrobiota bacterium]
MGEDRFGGFVNYGSPITTAVQNEDGETVEVVLTENRVVMPVFSTRKTVSSAELGDGQWLLMGGMPEAEEPTLQKELRSDLMEGLSELAAEAEAEATGPIFFLINVHVLK